MKKILLSLVAGAMLLGVPMLAYGIPGPSYVGHTRAMTVRYGVNTSGRIAYTTCKVMATAVKTAEGYDNVGFFWISTSDTTFRILGNRPGGGIVLTRVRAGVFATFPDGDMAGVTPRGSTGNISLDGNVTETNASGNKLMGSATVVITLLKNIDGSADAVANPLALGDIAPLTLADPTPVYTGSGDVVQITAAAKVQVVRNPTTDKLIITVNGITPSSCTVTPVTDGTAGDTIDGIAGPCTLTPATAEEVLIPE